MAGISASAFGIDVQTGGGFRHRSLTVRGSHERILRVLDVDEMNGSPILCDDLFWSYVDRPRSASSRYDGWGREPAAQLSAL